jgi:hypothetical protein
MNAQEIDTQVAEKLNSIFVDVEIKYVGETKRDEWTCDQWQVKFKRGAQSFKKEFDTQYYTGTGLRKKVGKGYLAQVKPVAPSAASILHSLLSDGQALETSFEYWCSDYGFDSDSISALNTYKACCEIGKKLNMFFNHEEREQLAKLVEEY